MQHDPFRPPPRQAATDGGRCCGSGCTHSPWRWSKRRSWWHLRHLYYPLDPQRLFPLVLLSHADLALELARELATVVMIVAVAVLAERGWVRRFAAFVFVFGLWDLGYYAWLKLVLDWPLHWLEWDVLFLIPWPWFGRGWQRR